MRRTGLVLFFALAGCVSHPGIRPLRPLEIATAPYQQVATTALTGTLMYEGECLLFRDEGTGVLVMPVWPYGSSFNGTAVLFHEPGKSDQWVAIAQELLVKGQPIRWTTLSGAPYQPVHRQCGAYPPFFVSSVRPAD